jgi:CubicO group peptidase (beta-lactamase class C family)
MRNNVLIIFMGVLILCLVACNKQKDGSGISDIKRIQIDSLLTDFSNLYGSNGIAAAIIKNTDFIYKNTFGYANRNTNEKVNENTLFHLGSIPKSFVAVALMQLVEQKKVELDSPIVKYIPELKFKDIRYKKITVRQVASHTSGIFTSKFHNFDKPENDDLALDRFVKSLDYEQLRANPGEKFGYSDTNYDIIGDIVSRVSGMPFEEFMKKNVLYPSGMVNSTFYLPDTTKLAQPNIDNYEKCTITRGLLYPVNRAHAPCGTLHSNINDMRNWMVMNMNYGKFGNNTVLKSETYKTLWNPVITTGWPSTLYGSMSLGWFVGKFNGKTTYLHSGTDHGYSAIYCIIPEDKYGIVILTNYQHSAVNYLLTRILNIIYNYNESTKDDEILQKKEYPLAVGEYYSESGDKSKIILKGSRLYFLYKNIECCLSSIREAGAMNGMYKTGIDLPFYYDRSNVSLQRIYEKDGTAKFSVTLDDIIFNKK